MDIKISPIPSRVKITNNNGETRFERVVTYPAIVKVIEKLVNDKDYPLVLVDGQVDKFIESFRKETTKDGPTPNDKKTREDRLKNVESAVETINGVKTLKLYQ